MRTRTLKPSICKSKSMGKVPRDVRLLFAYLVINADDEGRLEGNHRYLAHTLFPHDNDVETQIAGWLQQLEREECIRQYQVDGAWFVSITNWKKHQRVSHPTQSKIEPPPKMGQVKLPLPDIDGGRQKH